MDVTKIDKRIAWKDMRGVDRDSVLWMLHCWRTIKSGITLSNYCSFRCKQRDITTTEIYDTIDWGGLVEFHIKDGSPRVLLRRHRCSYEDVCVVFDIMEGCVITAYTNDRTDTHVTLGDIYTKDLNVKNILNKCIELSK